MRDIWEDGFEIERDGQKITLTKDEIREIKKLFDAYNGRGSIEYWFDSIWEDESEERIKAAEQMMEDETVCANVWQNFLDDVFYDSGEVENNTVNYMLDDYIRDTKGDK